MTLQQDTSGGALSIKKILLPIDGSEQAKKAALTAIGLAQTYKAELIVISVIAPPAFAVSGPVGAPADLTDYYELEKGDAESSVASIEKLAKDAGVETKSAVLRPVASVAESISDYAATEKVDLIVIGTRGLGGFKKLLLGSVSSGVLSSAPCSVFVVR
jgi:nucleotide-binding universal stress UspA family protein